MLFSECDVLPAPQTTSPRAADPFFRRPPVPLFNALFQVFFCILKLSPASEKVSPGAAQSRPKAPQGLAKALKTEPRVLPGARFPGFGEPLILNNPMVV